jgi:pimeloyl-ACP methyl ester carboxylesterase
VPQVLAEKNASELASKHIRPALARGILKAPLDLIGHSNGGYVCLYLAATLGSSLVRSIYTLGTPRGLARDYPVPAKLQPCLYHLRGGQDSVPTGGDHSPGDGDWVITFPDEGHRSLHSAADTNGVADIICYLAGMETSQLFVDEQGTIHPWEWCRDEAEEAPQRRLGSAHRLTVCDGVHDAGLDGLKAARTILVETSTGSLGPAVAARLGIYLAIRGRLVAQQEAVAEALAEARAFGLGLREEVAALKAENENLAQRLRAFERRSKLVLLSFRRECNHDVRELKDALESCVALAKGPSFGNREMAEVNALLEVALASHLRLNERVRHRARIPSRRVES